MRGMVVKMERKHGEIGLRLFRMQIYDFFFYYAQFAGIINAKRNIFS